MIVMSRFTREYLQCIPAFEVNSKPSVGVPLHGNHLARVSAMLGKPSTLCHIQDGLLTIPIKVLNFNALVSRVVQVVTSKQNPPGINETPTTLHVQCHVTSLDLLTFAIHDPMPWPKFEDLHVGHSPTVGHRL